MLVLSRGKIGFAGLGIGTGEPGGRGIPCDIGDKAPEEKKHLIKWWKTTNNFLHKEGLPYESSRRVGGGGGHACNSQGKSLAPKS